MFAYQPNFLPSAIYLIGAGGTGSRLMPMMTQLVKTCLRAHNETGHLTKLDMFVIDGDTVEQKNLARQNFIAKDVGQYKSVVLANRYSSAFNIPIYASTDFVKPAGPLNFIGTELQPVWRDCVVILAVDSAKARQEILKYIISRDPLNCFVIDAGNEDDFGQVRFFTLPNMVCREASESNPMVANPIAQLKVDYIPFDVTYYDRLGTSAQELSCADLPQTLAINAMMATLICSTLQNFLYMKPVTFDCVRYSMTGGVSTEFNTAQRWYDRAVVWDTVRGSYMAPDGAKLTEMASVISSLSAPSSSYKPVSSTNGIFERYFTENFKAYKGAGLILSRYSKDVIPIEPPKPAPELTPAPAPAAKRTRKKLPEEVSESEEMQPPAPTLIVPEPARPRRPRAG